MVDWWQTAALYGPALLFGVLFLVGMRNEPRRFRNAVWMLLFVLCLASALLLRFGTVGAIAPLALVAVVMPVAVFVFLWANFFIVTHHEGLSLATSLPALFALAMLAVILLSPLSMRSGTPFWLRALGLLLVAEGLWFFFTFAALLAYSSLYRLLPRRRRYDYIVVHGAGLDGTRPTPLLRGRLERAYALWQRQGERATFIVSGGRGDDEQISEAEAMRRYLVEVRHVDPGKVIAEDRSTTTMENLRDSKAIMDARGAGYRAALVTSDYHVFRACEYAHRIGLHADGVGSHTKGYYWPTAFIREFVAISRAHIWPYAAIAVLWLVWLVAKAIGA